MSSAKSESSSVIAKQFLLAGTVQGVGMRPTIVRLAHEFGLNGFVHNDGFGVEIHVEGGSEAIESFATSLQTNPPPASQIIQLLQSPAKVRHACGFQIQHSKPANAISTTVPKDLATCPTCLAEAIHSHGRRRNYPFVTCTDCGPRYSIIESMPFDRAGTSMNAFELCQCCQNEYSKADDRRLHAQTNACSACGPQLTFNGQQSASLLFQEDAFSAAVSIIKGGQILALKGVGGYQLVCDATCTKAVQRLRSKKRRPTKPLAVMVSSIDAAHAIAIVSESATSELRSPNNPIVVLPLQPHKTQTVGLSKEQCSQAKPLSAAINFGLPNVGLMLPTSTLHALLLKQVAVPCVVTSGNYDGDPLAFRRGEAVKMLANIADGWLHHNREILRPTDDSVVRMIEDRRLVIRAGRGFAPMSLAVRTSESILATGGHQKVAIALSNGTQAVLGPHIGDMNCVAARQRFADHVRHFCQLYGSRPNTIVHDLHPDYFTSRWASEQRVPTIAVQHHHAHAVSGMIEHGWLDREVLAVCFDGAGYGTDETIWGGEFLVCKAEGFRRVARLRPFALIGGDVAVQQPWRIAVALLQAAGIKQSDWCFASCQPFGLQLERVQQIADVASRGTHTMTSSVGRLFDGVASLLFNLANVSYEAEAAIKLEAECDRNELGSYHIPIIQGRLLELDWRPMLRQIVADRQRGIQAASIATKLTRSIANAVGEVCEHFDHLPIVLSGGCFQNAVLTDHTAAVLAGHAQAVGFPGTISPTDGSLAAGQLAVAAAQLQAMRSAKMQNSTEGNV